MIKDIDIQVVDFNSPQQKKSVELRYKVLREPLGLHFTEEQLASEKYDVHVVALQNESVIGVVVLQKTSETRIKMRQVAVNFELQRSGVGKALVRFTERYAKQQGFDLIELHARDTAREFYLKLDYHIEGEMFVEVGIPHYKMYKHLKLA
ncbi:MAG: Acetyltransferase [Bacteroidota bacterium]|nr:Acetyltransferase [Bacteroidota bacterium]